MKIAVFGCGMIAQEHLKAIRRVPGATIVGIADPSELALKTTADKWGIKEALTDPAALLEKTKPDVVHVATPPDTHEALTRLALEAGCHVYVEKPITLHARETEEVLRLAEAKGKMVCVGYMHNYDKAVLEALELFKQGAIGRICGIESYYGFDLGESPASRYFTQAYTTWAYGLPGGLFQNGLDHPLSVIMPFLDEPKYIQAAAMDVGVMPKGVPGELRILMGDGSRLASVTLSEVASPRFHYVNLLGTKGTLQIDLQNKRTMMWGHKPGIPHFVTRFGMNLSQGFRILSGTVGTVWNVLRGRFTPYEGMQRLVPAFYKAIETGGPNPMPPEYAIRIMRIMDQVWEQIDAQLEPVRMIRAERRLPRLVEPPVGARKVLVTGGTGFIGSRLTRELIDAGNDVRILARDLRKAEPLRALGAEVVVGNLVFPSTLDKAVEGIDTIYHLGATMGGQWSDYVQGTIRGTEALVEAARKAGVKRIVYAGTIAVYGIPRLARGKKVTEDQPYATADLTHYMRSKIEAERVLLEKAAAAGIEVSILRLGLVYGPEKGTKVSRLGYPVGSGLLVKVGLNSNTLPSVYVDHAVQALALAGSSAKAKGGIYNVVDDECFTQLGFVRAYGRLSGKKMRVLYFPYTVARTMGSFARRFEAKNGIARRVSGLMSRFHLDSCAHEVRYDNSRLKSELGWSQAAPLETCLSATFAPKPAATPAAPVGARVEKSA